MTEYWVSQGKKWCDFCKIFTSNNPAGIRMHELGQRHKDNVAKRLATMEKESAAREKQQQQTDKALEQIEVKAKRSYQKDLENSQRSAADANLSAAPGDGWEYDTASGYYYNKSNGLYHDAKSGFYYSNDLGKWVTQEEAHESVKNSKAIGQSSSSQTKSVSGIGAASNIKGGPAPGAVISKPLNPTRTIKGAPSSLAVVNKRKREETNTKPKPKVVSKEEEAALKAREAARKRVAEREKPLMGLYGSY